MLSWPELDGGVVGNMRLISKETVAALPWRHAFSSSSTKNISPWLRPEKCVMLLFWGRKTNNFYWTTENLKKKSSCLAKYKHKKTVNCYSILVNSCYGSCLLNDGLIYLCKYIMQINISMCIECLICVLCFSRNLRI